MVELGLIVQRLTSGCFKCRLPLNICHAKGVEIKGLGGWIYVKCDNPACGTYNKVPTGKQHKKSKTEDNPFNVKTPGSAIFDINTKAACGMIHSGIGEAHLNNLPSTMNLPQISHRCLKERETEIGSAMESLAKKLVDAALKKEFELSLKDTSMGQQTGIEVSSDAAWQKCGSQRSYNSLSGIASVIGKRTRKIVHFSAWYKRCRSCWYAAKHKISPKKHQCQLNWYGPAKAMELDMFVEMVSEAKKKESQLLKWLGMVITQG